MAYRNLPLKPQEYYLLGFKYLSTLSLGKRATFCAVFNSIPRKVKQVEGPIVFSGAMGILILSHIVKNSSKYLLHISNLPLKPQEYYLLGFKWNDLFYYDRSLPMGCSSSCQIFERFSTGLHNVGQIFMPNGMMYHTMFATLLK
jgi:hypothetical protein